MTGGVEKNVVLRYNRRSREGTQVRQEQLEIATDLRVYTFARNIDRGYGYYTRDSHGPQGRGSPGGRSHAGSHR